ncbi:MAG: Eco57I restriction-modification methylase domain-containing protein [Bacteroidaceae bacterium]|nr:Eco57I restriction-modification methylase domain-containing protein [Bacteroidaceae bacterium]
MYEIFTPAQTVNRTYLRSYINEEDFLRFKKAVKTFLANFDEHGKEEYNKTLVRDFLKEAFYNKTNAINTYGDADSAIYGTVHAKGSVPLVLIEAKSRRSADMIDQKNFNRKALHELVLYYLREEIGQENFAITNLIITDGIEWYVFKKKLFLDLFARDKKMVDKCLFMDRSAAYSTEDIYKVIKRHVAKVKDDIKCTHFSIKDIAKMIDRGDLYTQPLFRSIYKLLSPIHLLELPFIADNNTLNQGFYNELLYIMGLEEVMDSNTNLLKIKRLKPKKRQQYSMLEQAISLLEDRPDMEKEDEIVDTALGLVLEWTNRILFLKLLEAQLKDFDEDNSFCPLLTTRRLPSYQDFYELCMKMLAKDYDERTASFVERFPDVPYLNSSLFELSETELKYFSINALKVGEMDVYANTVVKDGNHKRLGKMKSLDYLFQFLGSYNFDADSLETKDASTIINASVLGLIFEKINGYKDGAFFTPGYITEYMCRNVIRDTVVNRFNESEGWDCHSFDELKEKLDYGIRDVRIRANHIINNIRICDPAVGSGHFLVSALNELVLVKHELGILQDKAEQPNRLKGYHIRVENDELVLTDEDDKVFKYRPSSADAQCIQEALFEEKRTIIENCLFGVDINPKSVDICRLRLWIELLKNAYYYKDKEGKRRLQTLPNIDINIKCGNSLLSKNPVRQGNAVVELKMFEVQQLKEYKEAVTAYKHCSDKRRKNEIKATIQHFRDSFITLGYQPNFFDMRGSKDFISDDIYKNSLEWMFDYPEVLDEEGKLTGFDIIVGNPPYVSLEEQKELSKAYGKLKIQSLGENKKPVYTTYDPRGDLYMLFVERAMSLLKPKAYLTFIIPNKWMRVGSGKGLRSFLLSSNLTQLVDFCDNQVFPTATTYTCIIRLCNETPRCHFRVSTIEKLNKKNLSTDIAKHEEIFDASTFDDGMWVTSSAKEHNLIRRLKAELPTLGELIGVDNAYYGIKTGLTAAFLITPQRCEQLVQNDASAAQIIRPFLQGRNLRPFANAETENYLLFLPKGFTKQGMGWSAETEGKPEEKEAWNWFSTHYPSVATHLQPFADRARQRSDKGDYWWELRACSYYDKFEQPKIFYQRFQVKPCFIYSNQQLFCNDTVYFLSTPCKELVALLNSHLGWRLFAAHCPRIQNGYSLNWINLQQIPVPRHLPTELATYADRLAEVQSTDAYNALYEELNTYINNLYGITEAEL